MAVPAQAFTQRRPGLRAMLVQSGLSSQTNSGPCGAGSPRQQRGVLPRLSRSQACPARSAACAQHPVFTAGGQDASCHPARRGSLGSEDGRKACLAAPPAVDCGGGNEGSEAVVVRQIRVIVAIARRRRKLRSRRAVAVFYMNQGMLAHGGRARAAIVFIALLVPG